MMSDTSGKKSKQGLTLTKHLPQTHHNCSFAMQTRQEPSTTFNDNKVNRLQQFTSKITAFQSHCATAYFPLYFSFRTAHECPTLVATLIFYLNRRILVSIASHEKNKSKEGNVLVVKRGCG